MAPSAPNHYDVLGISREADASEVRRAWKTLVQVWHPDRFSGDAVADAQERAAAINDAYSTLRDGGRRAAYDCRLAADERSAEAEARERIAAIRAARRGPVATPARFGTPAVAGHGGSVAAAVPFDQQLAGAVSDALTTVRRYPRTSIAVAAACILMLVGIGVFNALTGPSLPSDVPLTRAASVTSQDQQSLETLAAETRRQADATDSSLNQQLQVGGDAQYQVPAQPALAPSVARGAAYARRPVAASSAAARAPRAIGKVQEMTKPDGTHVLRIMPN
jgi:DnaJ-domain-containing protein 1